MIFAKEHLFQKIRIGDHNFFAWWTAKPGGYFVQISSIVDRNIIYADYIAAATPGEAADSIYALLSSRFDIQYFGESKKMSRC